jgi:UDP-glucose 4-epimerase
MKTMVVGGAGFIGSHLCDALLANGHKVVCVDNFSLGTKENIRHLQKNDKFTLYETDAADKNALDEVFDKTKPEIVYHLAANSDIQASAVNPDVEYRNTYTTTYNVLYCMRKYGIKKLFFASTSAVYGDKRDVILDENTPNLSPISYYGAAKLGSEALISAFTYMNDLCSLIFRFPNVIGPRLTHGVLFDFIRKLQKDGSHLEILGDGRQTKPYIYVTDLINAIIRFTLADDVKRTGVSLYNLGVDGETSVTHIADMLCEEMGLNAVQYHYTGGEGGWKGDVPRFRYCIDKIHKEGWKAEYTSDEAVRKTIQNVLNTSSF